MLGVFDRLSDMPFHRLCEICEDGQVSNGAGVCIAPSCDFRYCQTCSNDGATCETCSIRAFKASTGQCERCSEGCKQCTDSTVCATCGDDNYKPDPENNVCLQGRLLFLGNACNAIGRARHAQAALREIA